MRPKDWGERHGIVSVDNFEYFGEFAVNSDNKARPLGTGLCFFPNSKTFEMVEHIENQSYNGMFFAHINHDTGSLLPFEAGFYDHGKIIGPNLSFALDNTGGNNKKLFSVIFSHINSKDNQDGPVVFSMSNNEYLIRECCDGVYTNRGISFKYGKLILENLETNEIIDIIDCGWKFQLFYKQLEPELCFSFANYGVRPAFCDYIYDKKKIKYRYYGALMTYAKEQYYRQEKNERIFTNEVAHFGIVDFIKGDKYFGNIKSTSKEGGYERHGFGCYRSKNGDCYLGGYHYGTRNGFGIAVENNISYFGNFYGNKKEGAFFVRDNQYLYIRVYEDNKKIGDYCRININTYEVELVSEDGKIKYSTSFDKKDGNKTLEVSKEDQISDAIKKELEYFQLEYEITDDGEIFVTGSKIDDKQKQNYAITVPSSVTGIRKYAFQGRKHCINADIADGVRIIEEGAFKDCPNIKKITLSKDIKVIEPYTFTSKALKEVVIPNNTQLIKNYAFRECKNLERIHLESFKYIVIEEYAFPKKFKNYNGNNTEEDKEQKAEAQAKRDQKNQKIKEKVQKQLDAKNAKEAKKAEKNKRKEERKQKNKGTIAKTKEKIIDAKDNFFGFFTYNLPRFFRKIWKSIYKFFDNLFYSIGDFFKYTVFGFLRRNRRSKRTRYSKKSYSYGGDGFFKKLGRVLTYPFRVIFSFFAGLFTANGGITVLGILFAGGFFVLAYTGWIQYVGWDVRPFWAPGNAFYGYNFELMHLVMDAIRFICNEADIGTFLVVICVILLAILFVIGLAIDLLLYIFMLLLLCVIPVIVQILLQLVIVFVLPVAIPIVMLLKDGGKASKIISFIITLALTVLYYIFMVRFL